MEDVIYTLLLMTFILQQKGPIRFLRQENGQGEWERPRERRKRGKKMEDVQRKSSLFLLRWILGSSYKTEAC